MVSHDAAAATQRLLDVMTRLLGPDGCPWDRAQSHRSLLPYLLEEAYELVDAIEAAPSESNAVPAAPYPGQPNPEQPGPDAAAFRAVREELGDVLLQVVFHARLAEQEGRFDFAAVAKGLADKLIERHPHVFARERLDTAGQVSEAWDRRKLASRSSRLDGIPAAMPALSQAAKVSSRAAKAGFEWGNTADIYAKAHEELEEFRVAHPDSLPAEPDDTGMSPEARDAAHAAAELEFGDLLFSMVQLARWTRIDPETALRRSTAKFASRFRYMERAIKAEGRDSEALGADEWWKFWAAAKAAETAS